MLWPCEARCARGLRGCGGARPKDLGTLDGSRGGLILPRRVKAAFPRLPGADRSEPLPPGGSRVGLCQSSGLDSYSSAIYNVCVAQRAMQEATFLILTALA